MRAVYFLIGTCGVMLEGLGVLDHGLSAKWPYYGVASGVLLALASPFAPALSRHLYRGGRPISALIAAVLALPLAVVVMWTAKGRIAAGIERAAETTRVMAAKAGAAQTANEIAKAAYERALAAEKRAKEDMDVECSRIGQFGKKCQARHETHQKTKHELNAATSVYVTSLSNAAESPTSTPSRVPSSSSATPSEIVHRVAWAIPALLYGLSALCLTAAFTPIRRSSPPPLGTLLVDFATATLARSAGASFSGRLLHDAYLRWAAEHGYPAASYEEFLTELADILDSVEIGARVSGDEVTGLLPRS
jgi:hypothetical protein